MPSSHARSSAPPQIAMLPLPERMCRYASPMALVPEAQAVDTT